MVRTLLISWSVNGSSGCEGVSVTWYLLFCVGDCKNGPNLADTLQLFRFGLLFGGYEYVRRKRSMEKMKV